ncbi:MAG TPA: CHAD domain-containing protein [Terriglobales bacterium]|nr:CHAD domain-containing protein [Terriglobales bacterium]
MPVLNIASSRVHKKKAGLAFWMRRVLDEADQAAVAFAPDPVHDLRVALRRCCSLADGVGVIDPDPAWKAMKKAGKRLFRKLGELRDVHVMQEWVHRLDSPGDPVTGVLLQLVTARETQLQKQAFLALQEFDRKQWQRWSRSLPRRMARFHPGSLVFRHLALERWTQAYTLHRRAIRNRSQVGFHRLRIGVKRFRYIVENFLPEQHAAWSDDLKYLQDVLGEIHDLDVLWSVASRANVFPDPEARARWQQRIDQERARRMEDYRKKTLGKDSLWTAWRSGLPGEREVESAALQRLKVWASLLDPDFKHSLHVSRLALQLYDGLASNGTGAATSTNDRAVLQVAALLHDVGRAKNEQGHHKASYNMIRRLPPPLGWSGQDLLAAGIVARYHRGALPRAGQKALRALPPGQRKDISRLGGILRLANAFDASRDGHIRRLEVHNRNGFLEIAAEGYSSRDRTAEAVAAARHMLETVYRRPLMVKPMKGPKAALTGQRTA